MDTSVKIFSCHLFKQLIVFIIFFQHAFCQDLETFNGNMVSNGPNTLQNNLKHPLFTAIGSNTPLKKSMDNNNVLRESQLSPNDASTDSKPRQIRSTEDQFKNVTLCLSKIKEGDIDKAVLYFNELKSVPISDIINVSYHGEDIKDELKHFQYIIDFVLKQPDSRNQKQAIETIYKLLKPESDIDSWKAVLFSYLIENSPAKKDLSIIYMHLMVKKHNLKKINEQLVNLILNDVLAGDKLKDFERGYYDYMEPWMMEIFVKTIRNKSNVINKFDKILHFVHLFPNYVQQTARVYSILYDEVKKHDLLSNKTIAQKLGQKIKEFMIHEPSIMEASKNDRDPIVAACNALESCRSK